MELLRGALGAEPALEIALAATLLSEVATGGRGALLRIYRPPPTVAFGRRDAFLSGFALAVAASEQHGFAPVLRAQGGRAAAYDAGSVVVDEVTPATDSMSGIQERFEAQAARYAGVLQELGVDARVGEVTGEYCPGAFTVNARGERKLIGAAQRIVRGAWLMSAVVVVDGSARLRGVLEDVYGALELDWDPATVGSIADESPGATPEVVEAELLASYAASPGLSDGVVTPGELAAAAAQINRYRGTPARPGGG